MSEYIRKESRLGFSQTLAPAGRGRRATFDLLQSVPVAGREKTLPATLHDTSLIQDVRKAA
jgi:hypothetical protein